MLKFRVGQIWETTAGNYRRVVMVSDTSIQCVQWHNTKELTPINERTYEYSIVDGSSLSSKGSNLKAPYMWHINGIPVEKNEVLLPSMYLKDGKWDKVLNGSTIQKGDTWLTRDGNKLVIGDIEDSLYSLWPIKELDSDTTYSILGIRSSGHLVSEEDIVYLVEINKEECIEPAPKFVDKYVDVKPTELLDDIIHKDLELAKETTSDIINGANTQLGITNNTLCSGTIRIIDAYKYNPIEDVERLKNYIGDKAKQLFMSNSKIELKKLISISEHLHALETYLKGED